MCIDDVFNKNIIVLKEAYPYLYEGVLDLQKNTQIEVLKCKNGDTTLQINNDKRKILLHSKYDPRKEAQKFAEEKIKSLKNINIIYGFGMGYHLLEIQKYLEYDKQVYVFEINFSIFKEALIHLDLTEILMDKRFKFIISSDFQNLAKQLLKVIQSSEDTNFILHLPSVQAIPDTYQEFKIVLEELNLNRIANRRYGDLLYQNYFSNKISIKRNVGEFFNKFTSVPILIVSAGPSLDKNIHLIKNLKNRAVIISVGSAVKPLLKAGVTPDMFVISDAQEMVKQQIIGIEDLGVPGIFLATSSRLAAEAYNGPKFIALQEKEFADGLEEKYIVNTGGSVSTTTLDIAIRMGGNPIVIVGQDLAYTGNKRHVNGYPHKTADLGDFKSMRTIKDENGKELYTTLGLISIKKWIENRIREEEKCTFYNATEGGAFINGAKHLKLEAVIKDELKNTFDIQAIIDNVISNSN